MTRSITRRWLPLLTVTSIVLGLAACSSATLDGPGPALRITQSDLDQALRCITPSAAAPATPSGRNPVLLIHGTGITASESWDGNYASTLPALGYPTCTVQLPNRALDDIQLAAEYVVAAVRQLRRDHGQRVNLLTHSQGALEARWALKYWPDIAGAVDDFVSMAGSNHGTPTADVICLQTIAACTPAIQQQRPNANLLAALNANESVPAGVSYTSLYSLTDEIVTTLPPNYSPAVNGATNLLIQSLCPARLVTHLQFLTSGAVYYAVLDAFEHDGPADPTRIDTATACLSLSAPGVQLNDYLAANGTSYLAALLSVATGRGAEEPPLQAYAAPR